MEGLNFRIRSLSWLSCLLLFFVLIMINVVFARSTVRLDLTEEKLYTLSDGSRKILRKLEDPVTIKVFWHNVPLQFEGAKRYLAALLEEMENAAGDRVDVQWVDMEEDEGKGEASELGLEEFVFQAGHGKEVRQSKGYMSLAIEMGDEEPLLLNRLSMIEEQLEYFIIATIYARARTSPPIIGMVSQRPYNPFGPPQRGRFSYFERTLAQAFGAAARTYLTLDTPIQEDVDVLIVAAPRDLKPEQVYHLEQFLLRGGRAVLLLDPVDIDNVLGRASQQAEPHGSGLEEWLEHIGVTVEKGVVGDFASDCLLPRGQEAVRYPFWPKLLPQNMDRANPVTRNLPAMPMYWPAAIAVDAAKQKAEGRTFTVLASTTEHGYRRPDIKNLGNTSETGDGKLKEHVPMLVLVEGPMNSFWLGKPIPGQEPPDVPAAGDGESEDDDAESGAEKAAGSPDGSPDGDDGAQEPAGSPDGDDAPADEPKSDDAPADEPKKDEPKKDEPKEDDGDGEADAQEDEDTGPARLESGEIRLVLCGDAELIADQFGPQSGLALRINGVTGFSYVVSTAEWLSGSEEMLALRTRSTNPRNLEKIEDDEIKMLELINLLLVPLLVLLAGLTVFYVRRS